MNTNYRCLESVGLDNMRQWFDGYKSAESVTWRESRSRNLRGLPGWPSLRQWAPAWAKTCPGGGFPAGGRSRELSYDGCPRRTGSYGCDALFGIYEMNPPTYSQWVQRWKSRKMMIQKEINGGPGRITAYTDLHGWRKCKRIVGNNPCPVGCQKLTSFMTKIDWINFEQHVFVLARRRLHGCRW